MLKLSVIIPVYNEKGTIADVLRRVEAMKQVGEIVVIDDGSTDGTRDEILNYSAKGGSILNKKLIFNEKNRGKGYSLRKGFKEAARDVILVQDADLEYDPSEYPTLLKPILDGRADVVYGSRFISDRPRRVLYNHHYMANKFLTFISNLFSNLNISDMETCYKVFSRKAIDEILPCLTSDRFGIEVEMTAEIAKHRLRVYEVGISYNGRTYEEGKKISWKDGLAAIWHIIRYNLRTCKKS